MTLDCPNKVKGWNVSVRFAAHSGCRELAAKILEITKNADPSSITLSDKPNGAEQQLSGLVGYTLQALNIKHGDLLYLKYKTYDEQGPRGQSATTTAASTSNASDDKAEPKRPWELVNEEPVDVYWRSRDGKIPRKRDAKFCKHGDKGMCDYCMPLEPYDAGYHKDKAIKHLSFHAHLRKLQPAQGSTLASSSSTANLPPLQPESYSVKVPCPTASHPSFPQGICTTCQPAAITLQPQTFRMVDHVEFASKEVVDRFIDGWRKTGVQRFGFLIGRYEPYAEVPMGIKAVVEAIHEPPQHGDPDGLTVALPWEDEKRIKELGSWCYLDEEMKKNGKGPIEVLGQIFTDLTAQPDDRSKLVYKRHPQSFYMSSLEVIFAAKMQAAHPTVTRGSRTGEYGSRFVTAIVTGTEEGGVDIQSFQVSEQAVAMVQADMITASRNPQVIIVQKETEGRYIPEVFYRSKNQYGIEVKESAKPTFPVDFLLVNITHGFPLQPSPLFRSPKGFPIENRHGIEEQTTDKLLAEINQIDAASVVASPIDSSFEARRAREKVAKWLSDWHLLAYWNQVEIIGREDIKAIAKVATSPNFEEATVLDPLLERDGWQTLTAVAVESAPSKSRNTGSLSRPMDNDGFEEIPPELLEEMGMDVDSGSRPRSRLDTGPGASTSSGTKMCPHCTFENDASARDCEVCGLPL
ncbi:Nuclear protein localization protein 4 [Serendipita indica DSM 11827]|nr:Nuclear protein localization protein 4 [Serendipita indica DSM 11827]